MNELIKAALTARRHGVATVPVELPEKRPPRGLSWKWRESRLPDEGTIERELTGRNGNAGFAVIGGRVSGNAEIFDFDLSGALYGAFSSLVELEAPGLVERLSIQETQSGGYHLIARCPQVTIPGNLKLAAKRIPVEGPGVHSYGGKSYTARSWEGRWFLFPTAIETRGEGGYAVAAPSPGYSILQQPATGEFFAFAEITPEERATLHRCARALDESPPKVIEDGPRQAEATNQGMQPGADFNTRGNVLPYLLSAGFKEFGGSPERRQLTRPGKDKGISATLYEGRILHVFTSNAPPFEEDGSYSPFAVYTLLEHGGDFHKAAAELHRLGFGTRRGTGDTGGEAGLICPDDRTRTSEPDAAEPPSANPWQRAVIDFFDFRRIPIPERR
jgi:hypothetical protein